jgi:hypothetical protein
MKKFEDVCLGHIEFTNFGSDITFEIWSTYDGKPVCKIHCNRVSILELKSTLEDEELFGTYVALIKIINDDKNHIITLESGEIFIRVECLNITIN